MDSEPREGAAVGRCTEQAAGAAEGWQGAPPRMPRDKCPFGADGATRGGRLTWVRLGGSIGADFRGDGEARVWR